MRTATSASSGTAVAGAVAATRAGTAARTHRTAPALKRLSPEELVLDSFLLSSSTAGELATALGDLGPESLFYLLLDRSASTMGAMTEQQQELATAFVVGSLRAGAEVGVLGFTGLGGVDLYDYKLLNSEQTALGAISRTVGSGTPTAKGLDALADAVRASKRERKTVFVVTDGAADDRRETKRAIEDLRAEGVTVIGLCQCAGSERWVEEQFGDDSLSITPEQGSLGVIFEALNLTRLSEIKVATGTRRRPSGLAA